MDVSYVRIKVATTDWISTKKMGSPRSRLLPFFLSYGAKDASCLKSIQLISCLCFNNVQIYLSSILLVDHLGLLLVFGCNAVSVAHDASVCVATVVAARAVG